MHYRNVHAQSPLTRCGYAQSPLSKCSYALAKSAYCTTAIFNGVNSEMRGRDVVPGKLWRVLARAMDRTLVGGPFLSLFFLFSFP